MNPIIRDAEIVADRKSIIGEWSVECAACPLLPHLKALNQKPRACVAGIQTNMQGAVPVFSCEHYVKDSTQMNGKKLTIACRKEDS